jgi:molybdate transport system substrate-binding protein
MALKKELIATLLLALFCFPSLVPAQTDIELTVSAAVSLKNVFEEIARIFEKKNPGVKVLFNFGASGNLARQVIAGAPVDVFASASSKDMDGIQGLILKGTRVDFVKNDLVLIAPLNAKSNISSFAGLGRKEIKKIAIGNPATVPAGQYAVETLKYLNLYDVLRDRLVFGEHVRQVLDYVARDEVDAGIVYLTDVKARKKDARLACAAPEVSHKPVIYPIAVIRQTSHEDPARSFISFVVSPDAQAVFVKYGFSTAIRNK